MHDVGVFVRWVFVLGGGVISPDKKLSFNQYMHTCTEKFMNYVFNGS